MGGRARDYKLSSRERTRRKKKSCIITRKERQKKNAKSVSGRGIAPLPNRRGNLAKEKRKHILGRGEKKGISKKPL